MGSAAWEGIVSEFLEEIFNRNGARQWLRILFLHPIETIARKLSLFDKSVMTLLGWCFGCNSWIRCFPESDLTCWSMNQAKFSSETKVHFNGSYRISPYPEAIV
ncbi:MAG: hypothetical protein WBC92_10770 [Terracidiphilus sp.]